MTEEIGFYVELPADEDGNTSMRKAVVQARVVRGATQAHPFADPERQLMIPVAPPEIVQHCSTGWYTDSYGGWAQVNGPARILTSEEYDVLIAGLAATRQRPELSAGED